MKLIERVKETRLCLMCYVQEKSSDLTNWTKLLHHQLAHFSTDYGETGVKIHRLWCSFLYINLSLGLRSILMFL